jgi:predicted DNA-binding transcriptional regulator AlpA
MNRTTHPELVDLAEIAERLDVAVTTVTVWRYRHRRRPRRPWEPFPKPVRMVGRSPLFDWPQVEAWAQATGRLPKEGTTS